MRNALTRAPRKLMATVRRLVDDEAGEVPMDIGFSFSVWFFATTLILTFLDAYVLKGQGIQTYFGVPSGALAASRSLVNL